MTTTSQNPPWVLSKAVIVYTPDFDVSCRASLRIFHDETADRGSITLSITADLANPRVRSQQRRPLFTWFGSHDPGACHQCFGSLNPEFDTPRQCGDKELHKLERFSQALRGRSLEAEPFDHARHRTVQKDWHVFCISPDPPPYCQESVSEQVKHVDPPPYYPVPLDNKTRKTTLLSSPQSRGSPTEPDTPSTLPPSPPSLSSIRPTSFTHASSPGRTDRTRLARLVRELNSLSDGQVRKVLIASRHDHLLAKPNDVDSDLPSESEKVGFAKDEPITRRRLEQYIEMIIKRHISPIVDEIVDSAVSASRDQFFDECKTNEAEFREQVDDGNSEVRTMANECMKEMQEEAQKHIYEIEQQAQQCINDIQNQGIQAEMSAEKNMAKLKSWFNASLQSLLDSKSGSHELDADVRRIREKISELGRHRIAKREQALNFIPHDLSIGVISSGCHIQHVLWIERRGSQLPKGLRQESVQRGGRVDMMGCSVSQSGSVPVKMAEATDKFTSSIAADFPSFTQELH
ncbi:Intermediate filament protein [Aspergillus parasiticus SU-1]|uniref:Intermediate filament protein n=1 Tax=Aspergillus parasiticus (strain ATCC 56775 / NRRL 5862 / SRRC 143 / SU-1) TaxID=1403190 RepID=A0A0F0I8E3_ASPPU|nr:Intermediate filament protein [Aspergillus parasiticus SU-1]